MSQHNETDVKEINNWALNISQDNLEWEGPITETIANKYGVEMHRESNPTWFHLTWTWIHKNTAA